VGQSRRQSRKQPSPSQELPQEASQKQLQEEPSVELRAEVSVLITREQSAPALYTHALASAAKQPYPAVFKRIGGSQGNGCAAARLGVYDYVRQQGGGGGGGVMVVVEAEEEANQGPTVPGAQRTNSSNLASALYVIL